MAAGALGGGGLCLQTGGAGCMAGAVAVEASAAVVANGVVAMQAGLRGWRDTFGAAQPMQMAASKGGGATGAGAVAPTRLRPEAKYTRGGKHGLKWKEGPAEAKATQTSQGQWGSQVDLDFAGDMAATLEPGKGAFFDLPPGSTSVVHRPDGTTVPATRIWVRNNGTGTFHGAPGE